MNRFFFIQIGVILVCNFNQRIIIQKHETNFFFIVLTLIYLGAFTIISCEKEGGNETKISSNNSNQSHNNGQNCMTCHTSGGSGEGWFTAAGSVYNTNGTIANGGKVYLYTEPNGAGGLVETIEIDKKGNFYTTKEISFTAGVYPKVESSSGDVKFMGTKLNTGSCNSCHGSSQINIAV